MGFMNSAITEATKISRRSGMGWCLLDQHQNILNCSATLTGLEPLKLSLLIDQYRDRVEHVYLTMEPGNGAVDLPRFINSIEQSNCESFTIAHRFHDTYEDREWREWCSKWRGQISYLPENGITQKLASGFHSIKTKHRPWITAVSSANISGVGIQLHKLIGEFGFLHYMNNLTNESRAIIHTRQDIPMLESLPEFNSMDEYIELYEIDNTDNIPGILKYCSQENRCNVVALCDMNLLNHLINNDLVDEIIHHITNLEDDSNRTLPLQSSINLKGWSMESSSIVGDSNRMVLTKQKPATQTNHDLGLRLN